nr:hypothetical protein [Tanacetum cinerariifolium]
MSLPSSSSHATVEAATRSPDHATLSPVHAPKYPEFVTPIEDHPLLASASPIALSPDYLTNFELIKEDLEEEPEEGRVITAMEEVNKKVRDLTTTRRKDAHKFYVHHEDVQNKRALVRAQISLHVMEARIETLEAQVRTLQTQHDRME